MTESNDVNDTSANATPADAGLPDAGPAAGLASSDPVEAAPGEGAATTDPSRDATKDPEDWVTGAEAMTGPQRSYLGTLAREAGEQLPDDLTKAEASEHIDRLQQKTGRGA